MARQSDLRFYLGQVARILSIVLALFLFALILVGSISGFIVYQAVHPQRQPSAVNLDTMVGHPQTFSFADTTGAQREGWFFPGLNSAPAIVVCHGYGSQRADVLTLVTALQEHGFNVFLFDFAGHGTNPGVTTLGYRETQELASVVATVEARNDLDNRRIGLWGVDLGGYAVLEVAASDHHVAALAVDDAYDDPRNMLRLQVRNSGFTAIPYVERASDLIFRLANYSFRTTPPVSTRLAGTSGVTKLFITSADRPVFADETNRLFAKAPEPKQLQQDRQSYSDMSDDDRKMYESEMVNFFLQYLGLS